MSATDKPDKDHRVLWWFAAAFAVVFAVNGLFVYLAVSTNHGVVREHAYEEGLDYDHIVSEVRKLKAKDDGNSNE